MPAKIARATYARMFGPAVDYKVRLADRLRPGAAGEA